MNKFEAVLIINPEISSKILENELKKFSEIIKSNNGNILDSEDWGLRDLAYKIKAFKKAFYSFFQIEIEGNKILNVMVDHNYELDKENYGSLEDYFTFPFTYNEMEKTLYATNQKELKKVLKKLYRKLPKDHSHKDWKKMDVKLINDHIALVNAMFSRFNKKGVNYFTGAAMYTFRKDDNSWKILSITPYKPYNYFEFD